MIVMADTATISERWKIENITLLPYRVSIQELMYRYDCLVIKVNAYGALCDGDESMVPPTMTEEGKQYIEILSALRLVCSLFLSLSSSRRINIESKQCAVLESTLRRAWILQNLSVIGNCGETSDSPNGKSPFISVQIVETASKSVASPDEGDSENDFVLEWKYDSVCAQNDDVVDDNHQIDSENDDDIIPIAMMTRDELIQEENLLLQMANTPIPSDSTTVVKTTNNMSNSTTGSIRQVLCQEWGESKYIQLQSQQLQLQHGE